MAFGATHYEVKPVVRRKANSLVERYAASWNTYYDHPTGYQLDDISVDFWGEGGRGAPIPPSAGESIADSLLAGTVRLPIAWLLWRGRSWRPGIGYRPYNGLGGPHHDHVHVTFRLFSNVCKCWPQW